MFCWVISSLSKVLLINFNRKCSPLVLHALKQIFLPPFAIFCLPEEEKCCLDFLRISFGWNCRFSSEVQRMLVKQLNTLVQLLVCLIATPSHMCAPREGSMKGLEEEGTARDLGFKMTLVFDCEACHLLMQTKFC